MKKLMNDPREMLNDALAGLKYAHSGKVNVDLTARIVTRANKKADGKVALISGGGSGHEPMHAGFVGLGMLDGACLGEVFTSPTPDQMITATGLVNGGAGVLYVVKNYAGDIMNFEIAAEMSDGVCRAIIVNDDVALFDMQTGNAQGHRGVAGTVIIEKIIGALAERGAPIEECCDVADHLLAKTGTMAVALESCVVPALGTPTFQLPYNEIEIGVGIHGEPGRQRMATKSADEIADILVTSIVKKIQPRKGDPLLLFCNGLGGTPLIEQYVLFNSARKHLEGLGYNVARSLVGPYCTALDMAGASLTVSILDDKQITYWDDSVDTIALKW
jgi:phosphoenolpyruvate---glycerone phosphotransferase subunit DhaK